MRNGNTKFFSSSYVNGHIHLCKNTTMSHHRQSNKKNVGHFIKDIEYNNIRNMSQVKTNHSNSQ